MKGSRNLLAAALLGSAALMSFEAQAASNIGCIASNYSAEEKAAIASYQSGFSMPALDNEGGQDALAGAMVAPASECAEKLGWNEKALEHAVFYETSRLLLGALDAHPPMGAAAHAKLKTSLAKADPARLRAIFGPMVEAQMGGAPAPDINDGDAAYIGTLMLSSGLPLDGTNAEYIGAMLAAQEMLKISAEKFAAD